MCAFLGCSLFTNVGKVKGVLHGSLISDKVKMLHLCDVPVYHQQPDPHVTDIANQFNFVVGKW